MKTSGRLYLMAAGLLLSSVGCTGPSRETKPPCCRQDAAAPVQATNSLTPGSLYQVESIWTNDAGKMLRLSDFRGRPRIITMFFANCQSACPLLVADMRRIEKALPENLRSKVGFILVTFDPERDTPEALQKCRNDHHLGENWTLLRGNPDDVLELAALLGVKYKKAGAGQFFHSNLITILDRNGEIAFQQIGLDQDPRPAVTALQKLP